MRRTLLLVFALCCFAPIAHAAQGVNLRWDACMADVGAANKSFACNTNSGTDQLYVSFEVEGAQFEPMNGIEIALDIVAANSATIPSWWMFKNTGACRQFALSGGANALYPNVDCVDAWQSNASGGIAAYISPHLSSPDRARLFAIFAVAQADAMTLQPGTEYLGARFAFTHVKTVGTGACGGCSTPMCLGVSSLKLTRPVGYGDLVLADETTPRSSIVSWQNGPVTSERDHSGSFPPPQRFVYCSAATRASHSTWGSIKSLYH